MLTVRELMKTDVVTVSPDSTVRELARLLADAGISGVPVVTSSGTVLGVVSSSDIIRVAAEESESGSMSREAYLGPRTASTAADPEDDQPDPLHDYFLPEDSPLAAADWGGIGSEGPMDELSVSDIMTPVTFTLPVTASARDVAEFLVRGRIHRVVVVEDGRLQGIVTTMDVLSAVSNERI